MRSLTRQEVRNLDRYAIETIGISSIVLMENAGRLAADEISKFLDGPADRSIGIVAGAGNNGGDGFVIARHLAMRGAKVTTFLVASVEKLSGDAKTNFQILRNLRHEIRYVVGDDIGGLAGGLKAFDVVVDAVGGTGIRGELQGDLASVVEQINASGRPVVAIDIPTGLDCDSGLATGPAVRAKMTVTMLARKKGFDVPEAASYTGEVRVVDIGIPAGLVVQIAADG